PVQGRTVEPVWQQQVRIAPRFVKIHRPRKMDRSKQARQFDFVLEGAEKTQPRNSPERRLRVAEHTRCRQARHHYLDRLWSRAKKMQEYIQAPPASQHAEPADPPRGRRRRRFQVAAALSVRCKDLVFDDERLWQRGMHPLKILADKCRRTNHEAFA